MRKQCYCLRALLLVSLWCGVSISEAATIRVFNAVSPSVPGNIARVWAKRLSDVTDPVDLGFVGAGQYIEWTDPDGPTPLTDNVTFWFSYDPFDVDWWNNEGFVAMSPANWVTASMAGQVTPYVYLAPIHKEQHYYGTVRLWNRTATEKTVEMNPQVTLTIPAGENVEWSREMVSHYAYGTPFWSAYQIKYPGAGTLNNNQYWLFWAFQEHSGYTQMHIEGNVWEYCLTHAVPIDDNGNDMTPIEWGPCAGAGVTPPEPGAGGGGEPPGGGGEGGGGEGNGTDPPPGGGGEGGGGETTVIIDLTELINLATTRNNLLNMALLCCEEGHLIARNVSSTNSQHLIEIIELLQPVEGNSTDPAEIDDALNESTGEVDGAAGGMFAPLAMLFALGANPIAEPAAAAFRIDAAGMLGDAPGVPDHVSFDYRDVAGAETVSGWTHSVIAMLFVGLWVWAVYSHYEKLSAELWSTAPATTSGESIVGTNLNLATALINAGIIVTTVATLWIFAAMALGTVPCFDVIVGAFGDISAPAGDPQNRIGAILWTCAEFIPITCALTLIGTYCFLRVTAMVQVQTYKTIIKLAVA
jgi:hypothetical protein